MLDKLHILAPSISPEGGRNGEDYVLFFVIYFFVPNYISLIIFIGVALFYYISLLNFNYVLQKLSVISFKTQSLFYLPGEPFFKERPTLRLSSLQSSPFPSP
jgi:hypothetical protein